MLRTRLALLLAATTAAALAAPSTAASPDPLLCNLTDDRITESSGVVVSSTSDRRLFTHNDSGDDARFFAIDDRCDTTATYALTGVDSDDWEDVARGPGANGEPVLWFGDIGDNAMMREQIAVYRVAEPRPGRAGGQTQEVASTAFTLRYEDRAHDAETLLADPRTGQLFVVTKTYFGAALVYAAPMELRADEVNVLTRVGELLLTPTGTPGGPFGPFGQLSTTGGDVSPSGDRVVIRTYSDAYEWVVDGDLGEALTLTAPRTVTALPATAQGEAVTYSHDGRTLIVTSEGKGAPVHRIQGSR
jgi:hypothetical protein